MIESQLHDSLLFKPGVYVILIRGFDLINNERQKQLYKQF